MTYAKLAHSVYQRGLIPMTKLQTVSHTGTVSNFGKEHHHLSHEQDSRATCRQHRDPGKWNPQAPAYGRFWIDGPGGEEEAHWKRGGGQV